MENTSKLKGHLFLFCSTLLIVLSLTVILFLHEILRIVLIVNEKIASLKNS